MKKIILIFLFTLVSNYPQVTPEWIRRNTDMIPEAMVVDKEGNIFITGYSGVGLTDNDYTTVKYNPDGVQQWLATYSFPSYTSTDHPYAIAIDSTGNVYVTGISFGDTTRYDIATVKYNSAGVQQWVKRYDGPTYQSDDQGVGIAADAQGNVYVTGKNSSGLCIIKYSSSGDVIWVESPANEMTPVEIVIDESANVYITGYQLSAGYNSPLNYITIKYNSSGTQQWVKTYNGPGDDHDIPSSMAIDEIGNVYVTGLSIGVSSSTDYATIKYNASGVEEWVTRYNGSANDHDVAYSLVVNSSGDVYVTGYTNSGTVSLFATVKYNSQGIQQWEASYSDPNSIANVARAIALDSAGNVYVTGFSQGNGNNDYITIKYNPNGVEQWLQRYDGSYGDQANFIALDKNNNVYVAGQSFKVNPNGSTTDCVTIKYSQNNNLHIINPAASELWITGDTDTIKWTGGQPGQLLALDYSTDNGQTFFDIAFAVPVETGFFAWQVPNALLTTKAKIKITDIADTAVYAISDTFKIKGYILTKYVNRNYDPYTQFQDPYAFGNDSSALWPESWWQNFDYSGTDPYTGSSYLLGPGLFLLTANSDFPDWISWVRTFGVYACYHKTSFPPVYSPTAVLKWFINSDKWGGSCFGLSTSNVLLFTNKNQFISKYQSFPTIDPLLIIPTDSVKTVINELFTHQMGKEHRDYRKTVGLLKTPNETLREIKKMLIDDNEPIRTLSMVSNDPSDPGGHSIMAYKVEKHALIDEVFYIYVYDNAYPELAGSSRIIVDTLANNGNGTWTPNYHWLNWGGTKWFYLREPATNYLTTPSLPDKIIPESPFILDENELQILNTRNASILITDQSGNSTGYYNGVLTNNIPDAFPDIIENGSPGPPIGYDLPNADYSVKLDNYDDSDSRVGFFTGNKSYYYSRSNAQASETDNLFFDAGLSYSNPDINSKPINFICIENEIFQERAYAINNLQMMQNDSLKVEFADQSQLRIISYGNAKTYELSINFATSDYYGPFYNPNIPLSANTTHTLIPLWYSLPNNLLTVIVDEGNNGTIDDTLEVENQYEPLPVELISFTGKYINNGVQLDWKTTTELNNYGFEVERKLSIKAPNTLEWIKIGFVEGSGNSNSPKSYSFQDKNISGSSLFYRLKQIDNDGQFEYSNIIEVSNILPLEFKLEQNYPNPFNPMTTIKYSIAKQSNVTLKVYAMLGSEVATLVNEEKTVGVYEINFNAQNLSSGIYFYRLQAGSFVETKKMLMIK